MGKWFNEEPNNVTLQSPSSAGDGTSSSTSGLVDVQSHAGEVQVVGASCL